MEPEDPQGFMTMEDVAYALNISRSFAYKLIEPPHNLPAVKVGSAWRVERRKFKQWADALSKEGGNAGE